MKKILKNEFFWALILFSIGVVLFFASVFSNTIDFAYVLSMRLAGFLVVVSIILVFIVAPIRRFPKRFTVIWLIIVVPIFLYFSTFIGFWAHNYNASITELAKNNGSFVCALSISNQFNGGDFFGWESRREAVDECLRAVAIAQGDVSVCNSIFGRFQVMQSTKDKAKVVRNNCMYAVMTKLDDFSETNCNSLLIPESREVCNFAREYKAGETEEGIACRKGGNTWVRSDVQYGVPQVDYTCMCDDGYEWNSYIMTCEPNEPETYSSIELYCAEMHSKKRACPDDACRLVGETNCIPNNERDSRISVEDSNAVRYTSDYGVSIVYPNKYIVNIQDPNEVFFADGFGGYYSSFRLYVWPWEDEVPAPRSFYTSREHLSETLTINGKEWNISYRGDNGQSEEWSSFEAEHSNGEILIRLSGDIDRNTVLSILRSMDINSE